MRCHAKPLAILAYPLRSLRKCLRDCDLQNIIAAMPTSPEMFDTWRQAKLEDSPLEFKSARTLLAAQRPRLGCAPTWLSLGIGSALQSAGSLTNQDRDVQTPP